MASWKGCGDVSTSKRFIKRLKRAKLTRGYHRNGPLRHLAWREDFGDAFASQVATEQKSTSTQNRSPYNSPDSSVPFIRRITGANCAARQMHAVHFWDFGIGGSPVMLLGPPRTNYGSSSSETSGWRRRRRVATRQAAYRDAEGISKASRRRHCEWSGTRALR
jgi:hypothetical protein